MDVENLVSASTMLNEIFMLKKLKWKNQFEIYFSRNLYIIDMHYWS